MSTEKKSNRKIIKIIIAIIIILFLVPCIFLVKKVSTVNKILTNMAKNNEITNIQYTMKRVQTADKIVETTATQYMKDEKVKISSLADIYINYDGDTYFVNEPSKEYLVGGRELTENMFLPEGILSEGVYRNASFKEKIKLAINWKIEDDNINGEECYHLIIDGVEYWVNKNNYFIIKQKDTDGTIYEWYDIKVDSVTDETIALPDFSTYQVTDVENNSKINSVNIDVDN